MYQLSSHTVILPQFINKLLNSNELRQENKRKEMIKQRNQNAYAREQSYIRWVNPFTPINHNKLGSSQSWKTEKKYKYYD